VLGKQSDGKSGLADLKMIGRREWSSITTKNYKWRCRPLLIQEVRIGQPSIKQIQPTYFLFNQKPSQPLHYW
jgi:hypothetical protein